MEGGSVTAELDDALVRAIAERLVAASHHAGRTAEAELERRIRELADSIRQQLQTLRDSSMEQRTLEDQLAGMAARGDHGEEAAERMLRSILKQKLVVGVDTNEYGLEVETGPIVTDVLKDGTRRTLGRFKMLFRYDGGVHVACLNPGEVKDPTATNDRFFAYEHPHVYPQQRYGYPTENVCWGNVVEPIRELMLEGQFDGAVALTLRFMQTFHDDGTYSMRPWKVYVPEAEPVKEASPDPVAVEEEVRDRRGRLQGYRVRPLQGQHYQPRARQDAAQFRWVRVVCTGVDPVPGSIDGGTAQCIVCGRRAPVDRLGRLRAHAERMPQEEQNEGVNA
jgi:hypothetical protein